MLEVLRQSAEAAARPILDLADYPADPAEAAEA
jgi:hypothetical protein